MRNQPKPAANFSKSLLPPSSYSNDDHGESIWSKKEDLIMSKNTLFGPVVWSLDMRCAYIPIANTTTFLQLGPPSYDHEVYGDPHFMEGCIPTNEDMKRLLSNQASFDWEPAMRGSLPSVELHGRGGEISVRLIDCINQGERLPMEEKLHRKQLGLRQTGSELRKLLAND